METEGGKEIVGFLRTGLYTDLKEMDFEEV